MLFSCFFILLFSIILITAKDIDNICFSIKTPDLNLNIEIADLDKNEFSFKIDLKIKKRKDSTSEIKSCLTENKEHFVTKKPIEVKTSTIDEFNCNKKYGDEICLTKKVLHSFVNNVDMQNEIKLIGKKIVQIGPKVFDGLDKLKILNLSNNELKTIETYIFKQFQHLNELDLSYNNIFQMEQDAFNGFISLSYLNLMGNHLEIFSENILFELKNLTRLNLKYNNIPLKQLKKIRMFYNLHVTY